MTDPFEESVAQSEGLSLDEFRAWRAAFQQMLAADADGKPSAALAIQLLRTGRPIPPAIASRLADFLDGRDGALPFMLRLRPNPAHTRRMQRARNAANRARIGAELLAEVAAGSTLEAAIERARGSRSFLLDCVSVARELAFFKGQASDRFEWAADEEVRPLVKSRKSPRKIPK